MGGCGGQKGTSKGAKDKSKQYEQSRKAGKGSVKGSGKGAGGDAKGAIALLAKQTAENAKQMTVMQKGMAKLLQGSTAKKASGNGGSKYWTCSGCGDDTCFTSRKDCHKCGEQRVESEDTGKVVKTEASRRRRRSRPSRRRSTSRKRMSR